MLFERLGNADGYPLSIASSLDSTKTQMRQERADIFSFMLWRAQVNGSEEAIAR